MSNAVNSDAIKSIVDISDKALSDSGANLKVLEIVTVKKFHASYNDLIPKDSGDEFRRKFINELKDRTYWLGYYRNQQFELGGDMGVFIDANDMRVLSIYRGK